MEPVTHVLTGACLARAGFHRRVAYATTAMAVAAEFPDIDTLWSLRGPIEGFAHHRGITHTFLGIPFEAAFLLGLFWIFHRWKQRPKPSTQAPLTRWGTLYALILLALLSHILLDYTNNYGVRPFFPFNTHWFAASIVWIFDPVLFLLLLAGLLGPQILRLVSQEQSGRPQQTGVFLPRLVLCLVVVFWITRWVEHRSALGLAAEQTLRPPALEAAAVGQAPGGSPTDAARPLLAPRNTWASPDPLSIYRWYTVADFGPAYRLGVADTRTHALSQGQERQKVESSPAVDAALASPLGRVYMDWSALPWISMAPSTGGEGTTVTLQDLRFAGGPALLQRSGEPPLTGTIGLSGQDRILQQAMDGRVEPDRVP